MMMMSRLILPCPLRRHSVATGHQRHSAQWRPRHALWLSRKLESGWTWEETEHGRVMSWLNQSTLPKEIKWAKGGAYNKQKCRTTFLIKFNPGRILGYPVQNGCLLNYGTQRIIISRQCKSASLHREEKTSWSLGCMKHTVYANLIRAFSFQFNRAMPTSPPIDVLFVYE